MWAELSLVLSQSTRLRDRRTSRLSRGYTVRCITYSRTVKIEYGHVYMCSFSNVCVFFFLFVVKLLAGVWSLTFFAAFVANAVTI